MMKIQLFYSDYCERGLDDVTRSERRIKKLGVKTVLLLRFEWIKNIDLLIQPIPYKLNKDRYAQEDDVTKTND